MVKLDKKKKITFDCINIFYFWLIGFALVKTKKTLKDKYISWIKKNPKNYLYDHFYVIAFSIILKYSMIKIGIP